MGDRFYDYRNFENERVNDIFVGWNGLGGYHGLLVQKIAGMIPEQSSVLDVGSGGCHLLDALKIKNIRLKEYLGIDIDDRILSLAWDKHPDVKLMKMDFHDLNLGRRFDVVVACGLYSGEPERIQGVSRLMEHAGYALILTYFAKEKFVVPLVLKSPAWTPEFILHDIDPRLEILRLWRQ